ncbi:RNA ligase (ATP) [Ktedonobacter racemifer]|uniref:RNA ligase, DRB0094 family n=1 Tax=Ktedonobacter racemifer DSM 44963 TaxID=485913 RepID=D6TES5_KTERA|nr:RNA ligase (ATP) [Ktedonobacter racemifer]EFH88524.1 RNA ligase, DRB0094 family [Ktedonobacter racemifer DSM 44963]
MSSLIVPVATIDKIGPHSNADALELAQVLGWQIVVPKGQYTVGDKIVYFPPDTVLPLELSERFGVTKYLSKQRIRCAKLRGEPSFGLIVKPEDAAWEPGQNVADFYSVKKYEPPLRSSAGDAEVDNPLFWEYTEIENMRNFPDIFTEGETVLVSEKVHGTSSRVGMVEGELMAGSKALRRKRPDDDRFAVSTYWFPLTLESVRRLVEDLGQEHQQVILFGEVYGSRIQSFAYGLSNGRIGFRAFDLLVDGAYLDWPEFLAYCERYGIETVPVMARIPFSLDEIKRLSEGSTLLTENAHIREGVVVRPIQERTSPKTGRVILKYVSDSYLFGPKSDYTDK